MKEVHDGCSNDRQGAGVGQFVIHTLPGLQVAFCNATISEGDLTYSLPAIINHDTGFWTRMLRHGRLPVRYRAPDLISPHP